MWAIRTASSWLGAALTSIVLAGCSTAISPQLRDARAEVARAHAGPATRLERAQLDAAARLLARAETERDGSAREAHLAYLAERQALMASANARATELAQQVEHDRRAYGEEVAALSRQLGEPIETTRQRLARSELSLQLQQELLAEREQELAQDELLRVDEEERTRAALEALRTVALVTTEPDEIVVTLSGEVLFEGDRAGLRPSGRDALRAVAEALQESEHRSVVIEAHTDARGSTDQNRALSQRRADAVRAFLVARGVPGERLTAIGQGESEPIASNDSREGRASNRRVEIVVRPAADETQLTPATPTDEPRSPTTPSGSPGSGPP